MTSFSGPLRDAVSAARRGELIVFPTDTVYGIGTRPDDPEATAKVFEAKRRPRDLELPVLVANAAAARVVAVFDRRAERLTGALWPGPLTLVLPRGTDAVGWDLGGDPATVGVRAPHHPMALALLAETGPLAVTSANHSGRPPAETCGELQDLFGEDVAIYLCQEDPLEGIGLDRPRPRPRSRDDHPGWGGVPPDDPRAPAGGVLVARLAPFVMSGILVVCTGNICRSPMAEGFLRAALVERLGEAAPVVTSAGTSGWDGSGAMIESIRSAQERGADIRSHLARRLTAEMLDDADLIVCMATDHREAIVGTRPDLAAKTFTIKELVRLLEAAPAERVLRRSRGRGRGVAERNRIAAGRHPRPARRSDRGVSRGGGRAPRPVRATRGRAHRGGGLMRIALGADHAGSRSRRT